MRIAQIVGTVTLSCSHPLLQGARFKLAVPQMLDNLTGESSDPSEELVVYDELGAGCGSMIALSEGAEATMPFRPEMKPIDAYNAAILDDIAIHIDTATSDANTKGH